MSAGSGLLTALAAEDLVADEGEVVGSGGGRGRELEAVEEEGDGGERGVGPGLGVRQQVVELGLGGVTLESSLCASARISRGGEGSLSWGYFLWGLLERLLTVKFRLTSSRGSSTCSLEPSSWNMSSINCLT